MRAIPRGLAAAALAAGLACASQLAAAQEAAVQDEAASSFTLGGTVETRPFARLYLAEALGNGSPSYGQATSLGIDLAARGSRARAAASIETAVLTGTAASDAWTAAGAAKSAGLDAAGLLLAPAYDAAAAPPTLLEARVRSLYLKLDYDWFSLTAGRQVVKFQRGALWSPTDPFTELDLSGISPVRRGSDALRLALPLGATGAVDLVAAPKADFAEGRYAARLSGLLAGIDSAALAWRDGGTAATGTWNFGADFKADLVLGIDGEAVFSLPDTGGAWIMAAGGADYSLGDFIAAAEYYYNGGGAAADPNAPGSHNLYAALSWKATDFLSVAASLVEGLSTGTWSSALAASLDAAQNAVVMGYARLGRNAAPAHPWLAEAGIDLLVKF